MSEWTPDFDLTTVPDKPLWSEVGRRRAAKGYAKPKKLEPCSGCGLKLGAAERRKACPGCGVSQPRVKRKAQPR